MRRMRRSSSTGFIGASMMEHDSEDEEVKEDAGTGGC
jgi:hypothetical protein